MRSTAGLTLNCDEARPRGDETSGSSDQLPNPIIQISTKNTAHREARAIAKDYRGIAMQERLPFDNALDVDQR
jgi:hypothetical protein